MNLRQRLGLEWLTIGLTASALVVLAIAWGGTASFDNLLYDQLSAVDRPVADQNILIVAIDDRSLSTIGKWPWDRATHAQLITKLQTAKPRSITFDILLSESDKLESDLALAKSMLGKAPIFLPLHFPSPGSDGRDFDIMPPAPIFSKATKAVGHVNITFDSDGIVRRTALCFQPDRSDPKWPHLIELAYRGDASTISPAYNRSDCRQPLLLPYSKRGSFKEISYSDILYGEIPAGLITGRDIIVGATAAGMGDNFPVPNGAGGLLPGVEIIANMLGALRQDDFIIPVAPVWLIALSLLPLWLLLITFIKWPPRVVLTISLFCLISILTGSAMLLAAQIWFPPGGALLGVLLVYPLWGWRRLQAMSDFMTSELGAIDRAGEASPLTVQLVGRTDMVGRQSEALSAAISRIRDLRRFVSDTLAGLPDPMFVTEPEGRITLTNQLLNDSIGKQVTGVTINAALAEIVAPEHRSAVDRYLGQDRENLEAEFVRFLSPQGRTFVMRRSEVRSDTGELRGYIHYLTDITALARAETQREEVLQLLSHDMRAPQSTIIALLAGDIDEDAKRRIETNARKTMQLAQDFVDMARMAETEFDGDDVILCELLRDSSDNFWPLAKQRRISIEVTDNSNGGFVIAETDTLCRAIANLIDNAIKFSPDGGRIDIEINRLEIDLTRWLSVSVTDRGHGIAKEMLPRLFTRFATHDVHHSTTKGAGLGLTFVHAVVSRHGGKIRAYNRPGHGAVFVFDLIEAPDIITD